MKEIIMDENDHKQNFAILNHLVSFAFQISQHTLDKLQRVYLCTNIREVSSNLIFDYVVDRSKFQYYPRGKKRKRNLNS